MCIRDRLYLLTATRNGAVPPPPLHYDDVIMQGELLKDQNSISLELPEGNYRFVLFVQDQAGNTAVDHSVIGVDRTPPVMKSISPTGENVGFRPEIMVVLSEPLVANTVSLLMGGRTLKWTMIGNSTYRSVPDHDLDDFTAYNPIFSGEDPAGNPISISWTFKTARDPYKMSTVTGVLVNNRGEPLEGVKVSIPGLVLEYSVTDGSFTFNIGEGTYNLTFQKEGYLNRSVTLNVQYGDAPVDLGSIAMEPVEVEDEGTDPPYLMFARGIALILVPIFIAITAFTRKGGPINEE
jgi:hypothetical protein